MPPTSKPRPLSAREQRFAKYDRFVASITELCNESTKASSDLRSGLGRPLERCGLMHAYLVLRLPENKRPGWYDDYRRAHYTVAALIAARPRAARDAERAASRNPADATASDEASESVPWWRRPNLGASLAEGVHKRLLKANTAESDLHLMTRQSTEMLAKRLPALTRQLQVGGIVVDWAVLLDDLGGWNRDRDRVATRWLEAYFRVRTLEDRKDNESHENTENA